MSLRVLSIDSASTLCSVAVSGFEQDFQVISKPGEKHTEVILGMIESALKTAPGTLGNLDAIVFGAGPGAFTGLRVACGIAQGLGWALEKPLIAVENLYAIADRALKKQKIGTKILVSVDARMSECYSAVYEKDGTQLRQLSDTTLLKPEDLITVAQKHQVHCVVGNAFEVYSVEIPSSIQWISDIPVADASMLIPRATQLYKENKTLRAEEASPIYIRNHVAMTIDERKKASSEAK